MSLKRYCVEISQELITPIMVTASTKAEAKALVIEQQGEPGNYYFGKHRILSITEKPTCSVKDD
jgi:hypothetical protein